MKVENIINILEKFEKNTDLQVILINGAWGIGKTYQVDKYIRENKDKNKNVKKNKIFYIKYSLFGKDNIYSIEQDLYKLTSPSKNFAISSINTITELLSTVTVTLDSFDGSIDIPKIKKEIKKPLNRFIFFIDDIERKSSGLSMEKLLGFIDILRNLNAKIVLICNEEKFTEEIDKDNATVKSEDKIIYKDYKEKIVDKSYHITQSPENVLNEILIKTNADKASLKGLLGNNLRLFFKSDKFCNECIKILEKNFVSNKESDKYNELKKILLFWCACVVVEEDLKIFTEKLKKQNEAKANNQDNKLSDALSDLMLKSRYIYPNETDAISTLNSNKIYNNAKFIDSLVVLYKTENEMPFLNYCENLFKDRKEDVTEVDSFYLNDKEKNEKAKLIFEKLKGNAFDASLIERYCRELIILVRDYKIKGYNIKTILELLLENLSNDLEESNKLMAFKNSKKDFETLYPGFYDNLSKLMTQKFIKRLEKKRLDFEQFYEDFMDDIGNKYLDKDEIEKCLIRNGFFLQSLQGRLSGFIWEATHRICDIVVGDYPNLLPDLTKSLEMQKEKFPDDESLKDRVDYLLKEKLEIE